MSVGFVWLFLSNFYDNDFSVILKVMMMPVQKQTSCIYCLYDQKSIKALKQVYVIDITTKLLLVS